MEKPRCKACKKPIVGVIKIHAYRKKVGSKMIDVVDYYDAGCFLLLNKERSNERSDKKGNS
jgi:hypothetical protein